MTTDLINRAQALAKEGINLSIARLNGPCNPNPEAGSYPLRVALLLQEITQIGVVPPQVVSAPYEIPYCPLAQEQQPAEPVIVESAPEPEAQTLFDDKFGKTHPAFWDCDCPGVGGFRYIHPKTQFRCTSCGLYAKDAPDSRLCELIADGRVRECSPCNGTGFHTDDGQTYMCTRCLGTGFAPCDCVGHILTDPPTDHVPDTVGPLPAFGDGQPKPTHQYGDKGLLTAIRKYPPSEAVATLVKMKLDDRQVTITAMAQAVGCKVSEVRTLVKRAEYHLDQHDLLALPERKARYVELLEAEAAE